MREIFAVKENQRMTFSGVFTRYGTKSNWHGYPEKTILLKQIKNENDEVLTDHIWFSLTKGFQKLGELHEGDRIQFDARIKQYLKGYVNHKKCIDLRIIDYKLSHPTKVKRVIERDYENK
ncbi:MAG: hypothetical protein KAT16_04545 [Candidatus Heimdallarchaeota archaeon]|nr:hypothetical protein [Candidatus Heimdallarchaeota archaeon]